MTFVAKGMLSFLFVYYYLLFAFCFRQFDSNDVSLTSQQLLFKSVYGEQNMQSTEQLSKQMKEHFCYDLWHGPLKSRY